MEYIKGLLNRLSKLEPLETGVSAIIKKDSDIKAVIFDIYGTLLISSSGDVDQAEISEENLQRAFKATNIEVCDPEGPALDHILKDFVYTINVCNDAAKRNEVPHPEIDILAIWEIVLIHAKRKNLVRFKDDVNIMRMTCVFELLSNKVFPMPGLTNVITSLKKLGMPLGIVSNAQFYTPVLVNYFLNNQFKLSEEIDGFDPELTVYSYKLGKGKPDPSLFSELIPTLKKKYKLEPENVLFVGNDMLKDIYASNRVGFKTALFAGDSRSLRWRENDPRVNGLKPNYIITELNQLLEIV